MSTTTPNLGLFKYNPTTDGKEVFSIKTALNDNWDIIDERCGGGSRNIGEIVASIVPLTDAGLYPLNGDLLQREGIYTDFVDYIIGLYNNDPTASYFAQPSTEIIYNYISSSGNLQESSGILSGFTSNTTYAYYPTSSPTTSMELVIKCKQSTLTANQSFVESQASTQGIVLRVANASTGQINAYIGAGSWFISGFNTGCTLAANEWTYIKVTWNGSTYTFYQSTDGNTWTQKNATNSTTAPRLDDKICLGGCSWESYPFTAGSIDLSGCYLKCDGNYVWRGKVVNTYTAQQAWDNQISKYGVCGKFVCDSVSNTIRLPKYNNKIYSGLGEAPVKGNGKALGMTDGTQNGGTYIRNLTNLGGSADVMLSKVKYNSDIGIVGTDDTTWGTPYTTVGVTTDGSKSGIIADLSDITTAVDGYYYIVVSTSTKTAIQVDIDEIVTDLNGKVNKTDLQEVQCVIETYSSNQYWYRLYSDGWCEQGGYVDASYTSGNNKQIYFAIPFKTTKYQVYLQCSYTADCGYPAISLKTPEYATFVYLYNYGAYSNWYACGYVEV